MRVLGTARFWMDAKPAVEPLRFRRVPLLLAALCFIAGDVLAHFLLHTPFALAASTTLLLALAVFSIARRLRVAVLPVLALWVAAGCWCTHMQPAVPMQSSLRAYADNLSRVVHGHVERVRHLQNPPRHGAAPAPPPESEAGTEVDDSVPLMESIDLRLDAVEEITPDVSTMVPIEGGVRIAIQGGDPALACGDILTVPLQMHVPETYRDPGAWSHADELLTEGIGVQANVKASAIRRTGSQPGSWHCRTFAAQAWASRHLQDFVASSANRSLPAFTRLREEDAAMLQAMLFGDRTLLSHPLREGFERTGTFHLFVVSGLHVAIVAGALFWVLRKLRLPLGLATLTTVALTGGYALLTGFGPPVQRAFLMSAAYLIARWLGRERSPLNALGAAVLAVLLLDPRALFESSFQMTMLVIVALAGIAAPLTERWMRRWQDAVHELWTIRLDAALPPRTAQLRVKLRMAGTLCAELLGTWARNLPLWLLRALHHLCAALLFGIAAEICMMLPMALYFHRATLIALPLNAICIPVIGVLVCAAAVTFVVSLLSTHAAVLPAAATALLLHLVRGIVNHTGHTEIADLRTPMPATIAMVAACGAIAWACWSLRMRARPWVATGLPALALVPVMVLWPSKPVLHPDALEVTALDVGQGDALFLAAPDGHTMLVDAGGPVGGTASADGWDVGEEVVAPYLWSRRVRRLDIVVITHAHSDHMGGMPAILRDFRPRELWLSVQPGRAPALHALLDEAHALGIEVHWLRAGDKPAWGGLHAEILSPSPAYANPGQAANDDSLVMRLRFGQSSVLLEGDAEARSEAAMVEHGLLTPVTLLKVGHHGSRTSTIPPFLAAVHPRDAVISVGSRNTFGHPRYEVLQRLEAAGTRTFRTDRLGAETFLLRSDGGIDAEPGASNGAEGP